jgi:hypothetical protein
MCFSYVTRLNSIVVFNYNQLFLLVFKWHTVVSGVAIKFLV